DAQDFHGRGIRSKTDHYAATAGNPESTGLIVRLPEVGSTRHRSDYIGCVIVSGDSPVSGELESLPVAVRMHSFGKDYINPLRHSPATEHTMQTRHAESKRKYVIMPKRVSEEIKSIERGPATQFCETLKSPAVVTALQPNTTIGVFDSHVTISEASA